MRIFVLLIMVILVDLTRLARAEEQITDENGRRQQLERQLLNRDLGEGESTQLLETMTAAGFSLEEMEQLGTQLAASDRLLRQSALDKMREGTAKGVPPQVIIAAVEKVRNRLEVATRLATRLHFRDDQTIVEGFADSLAAGLGQEQASQLALALQTAKTSPEETRDLTVETVLYARDMARRRVASTTIIEVLNTLLSQGVSAHDMRTLRQGYSTGSGDPKRQTKGMGHGPDQEHSSVGQKGQGGGVGDAGQGGAGGGGGGGRK